MIRFARFLNGFPASLALVLSFSPVYAGVSRCLKHTPPLLYPNLSETECPACSPSPEKEGEVEESVNGWNQATFRVFEKIRGNRTDNIVISPQSIQAMFVKMVMGSAGQTTSWITGNMGAKPEHFNSAASPLSLLAPVPDDTKGQFKQFHFMALDKSYQADEDYLEFIKQKLSGQTEIVSEDFGNRERVENIASAFNRKICAETEGEISDCLDPDEISGKSTAFVLANVVYFYYPWRNQGWVNSIQWDAGFVGRRQFTLHDGSRIAASMIENSDDFYYGESEGWKSVALPYKDGFEMVIALPPEGVLPNQITSNQFGKMFNRKFKEKRYVTVTMPEYEIDSVHEMQKYLSDRNSGDPFRPGADFSSMIQEKGKTLHVSKMLHKAVIKTDRLGTKAAAATVSYAVPTSGRSHGPLTLVADRPFLAAILDTKYGAVRFIAEIYKPENKNFSEPDYIKHLHP